MPKFYLALATLAALTTTGCSSLGLGSDTANNDSTSNATSAPAGGLRVNDSEIVASIQNAFKQDPELAGASLNVSANGGVVTLSGNVPSAQAYNRAISLARNAPGVRPPVKANGLNFKQ